MATLVVAGGLVTAAGTASAVAPAAGNGYIRPAHLVPDLPRMDVTLSRFSGPGTGRQTPVLTIGAAYGDVGSYAPVAAGFYAVSLRPAGAAASSAPILSTTVEIKTGGVYTAAGVGTAADARLALFSDDLAVPGKGTARVRVINAARSASPADVVAVGGPTVASKAGYAQPTAYATVPAGSWELTAVRSGTSSTGVRASSDLSLAAGGVYTLLLLETGTGMKVTPVLDAAGSASIPRGGAATGLGGAAELRDSGGVAGASGLSSADGGPVGAALIVAAAVALALMCAMAWRSVVARR